MELFERILKLVDLLEENSQTKFAKKIGASQSTFNTYLNFSGQKKIRKEFLDRIIETYPNISRIWLYFGEGEMLITKRDEQQAMPPDWRDGDALHLLENMKQKLDSLEQELVDERRLNRQLTTRLLVDGAGDKSASKNTAGKVADGQ